MDRQRDWFIDAHYPDTPIILTPRSGASAQEDWVVTEDTSNAGDTKQVNTEGNKSILTTPKHEYGDSKYGIEDVWSLGGAPEPVPTPIPPKCIGGSRA